MNHNPKIDYLRNHIEDILYIDNCSSEFDLGVIFIFNLLLDNHIDKAVENQHLA